jgi:hypothetical protein
MFRHVNGGKASADEDLLLGLRSAVVYHKFGLRRYNFLNFLGDELCH